MEIPSTGLTSTSVMIQPLKSLLLILFSYIIFILHSQSNVWSHAATTTNEPDRLALLDFKDRITRDPFEAMSSWNDSIHFCRWTGVSCSPLNRRVVALNLENQELVGSFPPSIGNLTFLTAINLTSNFFHSEIPEEIGRLVQLQHLKLKNNSFTGKIPTNLTYCLDLISLDLRKNKLMGYIPDQLCSLKKLSLFLLDANNLTGRIPPWIGNFSSLIALSLMQNNLHGFIPDELSQLSKLEFFQVSANKLTGMVPPPLFNISSMYNFGVAINQLQGHLPPNIGFTLPNLRHISGGTNNFTGLVPASLSNISGLQLLDFPNNQFTGPLPMSLGKLKSLTRLNFGSNQISFGEDGDLNIITSLANCTNLELLGLEYNLLKGNLPKSFANLSTNLRWFTLGGNNISGSIPEGVASLVNLTALGLENNLLTGSIPLGIGKLQKLQELSLYSNRFSRHIPSSIGNLSRLISLSLEYNDLKGNIPPSLGKCQSLIKLSLHKNKLHGTIPKAIFNLSSLSIALSLGFNSLTGSLPLEVGNLKNLGRLFLSDNKLSGEIPSTLANCIMLERLFLVGNSFQGTIPQALSNLKGLQFLDVSRNNLSGRIPEFLAELSTLKYINLSFNDFYDKVPTNGIFSNSSAISIVGNKKLCGGIAELGLPVCSDKPFEKSRKLLPIGVIIPVGLGVLLALLLSATATWYWIRNLRKRARSFATPSEEKLLSVSYIQLFKSTNGFSTDNLIGVGSFGSVYKADIRDNSITVAVKVLNLEQTGASKSFIAECEALRNIRHRNLLKVLTACSSIDSDRNDFKALVFELMSNGNLDEWIHTQNNGQHSFKRLSICQRLNIAIDVASALEYLHHECETPIVHCDLKPSNVLLNEDMTAHVGDFGLARFLLETTSNSSTDHSVGLKGSIGYIPPEYGMGAQVSTYGDIYSFGILLLEMFSGRRPTDDMFEDGENIHSFVI